MDNNHYRFLDNNRYRIIRTLGSGGFGDTFLAQDVQMPSKRRCVIKQLKPVNNNPQVYQLVQERFQREAAILEELGEGNSQIPRLYAYLIENGEFYLIQEWIEGETLSQKVSQSGRLSESSVKEILVNILPVLDYVHGKRIVHRDIKPDNIILRHRDNQPVLIDFGAVRETMGTVMTTGGNATSSIVIGTPGYMPSEQSAGRPVYSSDLYSLGLTAVYLLTGKMPQELETDYHTGEIVWHRHALNVSPTLSAIIDKAIQSHPRDRFLTAQEMLKQLNSQTVSMVVLEAKPNSPVGVSNISFSAIARRISFYENILYLLLNLKDFVLESIKVNRNKINIREYGNRIIALTAGGVFLGGMIAQMPGTVFGAITGLVLGLYSKENQKITIAFGSIQESVWQKGDRIIALTAGGVFVGGTIAQIPGAIIGGVIAIIFGLFSTKKVSKPY